MSGAPRLSCLAALRPISGREERGWLPCPEGRPPDHPVPSAQLPAVALAGWAVYCDVSRSLLLCPFFEEGGRWLLYSQVVVVWLRSGVECHGAVKFSRCTGDLWDLPACRVSQEGASLEEVLGTWADPLVLGSNSRWNLPCWPSCLRGLSTPGASPVSFPSSSGSQPLRRPQCWPGSGVARGL